MIKLSGQIAEKGLKPFIEEEFIVGGHKMPKVWILVADSKKAYFFRKPNHHLEKIGEAHSEEGGGPEIQGSGGGGCSRLEVHDEVLNHNDEVFMKALAEYLNEAAKAEAFDRLVLGFTPKMLGLFRRHLGKEVQVRIVAELDKDLTHFDEKKLYEYLDKALWI